MKKYDCVDFLSSNFGSFKAQPLLAHPGADLGFSRGGRIFKKCSKVLTAFFFRSTKLIFRGLPEHFFAPILAKFSTPQANF